MQKPLASLIGGLFLFNVCLQVLDGLITYHAVSMGIPEGNPLIQVTMTQWGIGWGVLSWKVFACGCLAVLFALRQKKPLLVAQGLAFTGTVYVCFIIMPLIVLFL